MLEVDNGFRLLFEVNYNNLCRVAYHILHEKDTAREIVQEVFIELWKKGNWQELQSPKAYLHAAVHNRSINALNRRKRFLSEDAIPQQPVWNNQELEIRELEEIITQAINSLPEQCKKIFLLSREEGMKYTAIALRLGLSLKTVERQMGIALEKLRMYLNTYPS